MNQEEVKTGRVSAAEFRDRSMSLFRLCEAWLSGTLSNEEFLEQYHQPHPSMSIVNGRRDLETSLKLSDEFGHAAMCLNYVEKAIHDLRSDGFGEKSASALRAMYFTKQVTIADHVLALNSAIGMP